MRRLVTWLLILVNLLTLGSAIADDLREKEVVNTDYVAIKSTTCSFSIISGSGRCEGRCQSQRSDTTTTITLTLQRKPTGSKSWKDVSSWSNQKSGKAIAEIAESATVYSGYDYRVRLRCVITDSNGVTIESTTKYSSVVSY